MPDTLPLMIFAAGFGTRMGALTVNRPKPLVPVAGRTMMDRAIAIGREAGCAPIVANTHYLAEQLGPVLATAGVIESREADTILDTGGGLKAALDLLGGDVVLTLNPDALWLGVNPLRELMNVGLSEDADACLLMIRGENAHGRSGPGDFSLSQGRATRGCPLVYSGAQLLRADAVRRQEDTVFSLNAIWNEAERAGRLAARLYPGAWCDLGHPGGITVAERLLGACA